MATRPRAIESAKFTREVVNTFEGSVATSVMSPKVLKKRGPQTKIVEESSSGSSHTGKVIIFIVMDLTDGNNPGKAVDGIGSLLFALCDSVSGLSCPSTAHSSTCACASKSIGEVFNPDTMQTEGVSVDLKEEVQPVRNYLGNKGMLKRNGGRL